MLTYLRSTHYRPNIKQKDSFQPGSWVRSEEPDESERVRLMELGLDQDVLIDALDPHEVPRVELDGDWIYFITRIPVAANEYNDFTTPLLFGIGKDSVVTVSPSNLESILSPFIDRTVAATTQKTKLFMLMMEAVTMQYQTRVAAINRQMRATTYDIGSLKSVDIARFASYERRLNDYLDALQPTNLALEKVLSGKIMPLYENDRDIMEDLSIEVEQVMVRCNSLLRNITNARDSYRAVMDTRLNETMRLLTVMTVVLTVPTMIAGLFGMNVKLPVNVEDIMSFWGVVIASVVIGLIISIYFFRRK